MVIFGKPLVLDEHRSLKKSDELFAYAEYFGVGLLVLELPRNAFEDFAAGRKTSLEGVDVFELYPAPRRFPQCNAKQEYLKSIGIQHFWLMQEWNGTEYFRQSRYPRQLLV